MAIAPRKRIWLCASNSTHVKMWARVARCLQARHRAFAVELLSLGRYYGRIRASGYASCWKLITVRRSGGLKPYWECTFIERAVAVLEARRHIRAQFRARPPSLVLLGNDTGIIEAIVISTARSMGIKTLLVQDGILGSVTSGHDGVGAWLTVGSRALLGLSAAGRYGMGGTDMIALMGSRAVEYMLTNKLDRRKLVITGQPRYDGLRPTNLRRRSGRGIPHKRSSAGAAKPVLAVFSQPMARYGIRRSDDWDTIVAGMLSAACELRPSFRSVVKLHPAETRLDFLARHQNLLREGRIQVLQGLDVSLVLQAIDVAIVYTSTVALEAMLFDKPVVIYLPKGGVDAYGFIEMGAALSAETPAGLVAAIRSARDLPRVASRLAAGRRKAISAHLGTLDGRAGERVARLVGTLTALEPQTSE